MIITAVKELSDQQPDGKHGVRNIDFKAGAIKTALQIPSKVVPIALFYLGYPEETTI